MPESANTAVYAALWLLTGMFLNPTASVPSTVQAESTPLVGVPSTGVTKVGDVANTKAPVPVSSVTAEAQFEEEGVPKNVATPAPREVMPVPPLATGSVPVTLVVRLANVVEVVPVPPLAIANVPASVTVPDVVIGPPDVVKPVVPPDTATLVTDPVPEVLVAIFT